jgi:peptide/nickel transport system substrate-binding protein
VSFILQRHPDYYDKDFALLDGIDLPIVSDYAQRIAQLKAGNLHYLTTGRAEDVITIRREEPRILQYESEFATTANPVTFGHLPAGSSKFNDERVRQAFAMAVDRDLWIDVKYNVDRFEAEGLPVTTAWNSHLAARESYIAGGWWLDPKGKDFGPNAKYFQFNLEEAKKLLAAAGHPRGFETTFHYPASPQYNLVTDSEPMTGFWQALGINVKVNPQTDYTNDYIPNNRDAQGAYEGIANHSVTGSTPSVVSPVSALVAEYWPRAGVTFHGFDINGRGDKSGDPQLNTMLEKMRSEKDTNAAKKLAHDVQRYLAKTQYALIFPGGATGFWHAWPALRNFRVWRGTQSWFTYKLWLDRTKAPFA